MSRLFLSTVASGDSESGLVNVLVSVCDSEGVPVRGLKSDSFSCDNLHSAGVNHWQMSIFDNEAFEEFEDGRYRLALHCRDSKARAQAVSVSVRQAARRNPPGLSPVFAVIAQGHAVVPLRAG